MAPSLTLIECLRRDIERHQSGKIDEIGAEYKAYTDQGGSTAPPLAFNFWDSWVDEKDHGYPKFYDEIGFDDWPVLAQSVIDDLEKGQDATHPVIVRSFTLSGGGENTAIWIFSAFLVFGVMILAVLAFVIYHLGRRFLT